jgi:hypothetical protein
MSMIFNREWSMPNRWTFQMKPVRELLGRYMASSCVSVDPFCGTSTLATHRNDMADTGVHSVQWLDGLVSRGVAADIVLLDPPYSPRQISECYKSIGLDCTGVDTQNSRLYSECKKRLDDLLKPGGTAITFGWNSCGFGKKYGYEIIEIMLVCHGAAHNDTIVVVEKKHDMVLFNPNNTEAANRRAE